MSKLIVILGSVGAFAASQEIHRDIRNSKGEGVKLVKGDLNDQASLERAFSGANAIFGMTDIFQHVFADPSTFERAEKEGENPFEIAKERDMQQGKNLVHAAAKQMDTLDRFVFPTLSDARKWSHGEVTENYHFDTNCAYVRNDFHKLAEKTIYLHFGNFLSNWRHLRPRMFRKQCDGSMLIQYILNPSGKAQPWVDAKYDTGRLVRALILSDKAPAGTTMAGIRDKMMTVQEYAALWGKVNGIGVAYHEDAGASGLPDWFASELLVAGGYPAKYGAGGGDPEVKSPEERGVDVSKLLKGGRLDEGGSLEQCAVRGTKDSFGELERCLRRKVWFQ